VWPPEEIWLTFYVRKAVWKVVAIGIWIGIASAFLGWLPWWVLWVPMLWGFRQVIGWRLMLLMEYAGGNKPMEVVVGQRYLLWKPARLEAARRPERPGREMRR